MNNQKGQSLIEFALIVPMLIFLFLAILYMGITFLDYTQYNNAARDMARDIALTNGDTGKDNLRNNINAATSVDDKYLKPYINPITKGFIEPKFTVSFLDSNGKPTKTVQKTLKDEKGNAIKDANGKEQKYNVEEALVAKEGINVEVKVALTVVGLPQPLKDLNILPDNLKTLTYRMRLEKTQTMSN